MVQTTLSTLTAALHDLLGLAAPAALTVLAVLAGLLLLGLLDRARAQTALTALTRHAPTLTRWAAAALALGAGLLTLTVARHVTELRLAAGQNARYANAADPDGGPTTQQAPHATLVETRTYSRSLVLPPDVYARIRVNNGWEQLLPYLGGENGTVQNLREGFTRTRGGSLVYTRDVTMLGERPLDMDRAAITTDLNFVDPAGGRGTYYNASFRASYTFSNPLDTPATLRFEFPLPQGSGTLNGFQLTVNGETFHASDLLNGSVWQGTVPARGAVRVEATYRNQGARGWSHVLSRREAIRSFELTLNTDRPARFQRYTLFPTAQTRSALSGRQTLKWQLTDAVTAQDIAVAFTQGSVRETLTKVGLMKSAALLLTALLLPLWAATRRLPLPPLPFAAALLGLSLGFTLGSVLGAYLPPQAAELLGSASALLLAWTALGGPRTLLVPLLLCAALPLAFLTGGHAGLLVTSLAATTLLLLLRGARATPVAT
ncbi:hypothetical protein [Deinococcus aquaticus]|uniref:hypothetical protein n=1 Tax=Deinococcus aquaticus TaxID=328692 RepID=UPI003607ADDA